MIDQDTVRERAYVLGIKASSTRAQSGLDLEEAVSLTEALDAEIAGAEMVTVREVNVANFLGGGKIGDIRDALQAVKASLVVVNTALTPIQQRNLEKLWNTKVIDRTGLILEIFALRAATAEGRLQVEMARLGYERSRLVRTWTHLERQRGGQGFLAGPGESQIESDRRVLNDKITKLRNELEVVRNRRSLQSQKRKRAPERVVALVGYTNAGKSTLFNALTEGDVFAEDMLFATLDTTLRKLPLPNGKPAILSDTVGFIADLPTDLISAFRATLEEVKDADLLLHVRDMSDPLTEDRKENVLKVLGQIEAGPEFDQPMIEVWNKTDLLGDAARAQLKDRSTYALPGQTHYDVVLVSALRGTGLDDVRTIIEDKLSDQDDVFDVQIPPQDFQVRAWLHENGQILNESMDEAGVSHMTVQLSDTDSGKFQSRYQGFIV